MQNNVWMFSIKGSWILAPLMVYNTSIKLTELAPITVLRHGHIQQTPAG